MSDSCVPIPYNRSDFDGASSFCNGMARVERDGLHGYISNTNHLMEEIPCQYEAAFDFDLKHPYAVVMIHGKYGMIDKSGNEVVRLLCFKVMVIIQKETSTFSPTVKNIFKSPVNIKINTKGFIPLTMDFSGMVETAMVITKNKKTAP